MGHNLGMLHDFDDEHGGDEGECNGQGLMSYGDVPQQWSSCSAADYLARYNEVGGDSWCMEAAPTACSTDDDSTTTTTTEATTTTEETSTTKTKLLIVTGTDSAKAYSMHSEIIDLEEESYTCSVENHFPHFLKFASGGVIDGTPFLCGGGDSSNVGQNACFYLNGDGEWKEDEDAVLPSGRMTGDLGSTVIDNSLVVFGDIDRVLTTIDMMIPGNAPTMLDQTLSALWGACTVANSDEEFMVIGGYTTGVSSDGTVDFGSSTDGQKMETYLVDVANGGISNGLNMTTGRVGHGCSPIIVNDESYIVVTGGKNSKRSTEILGYDYGEK